MKNKITNNWGLKLLSLVLSFFLWIVVTNTNDPSTEIEMSNIPVRFTNTDIVTSEGRIYEVLDNTDIISTVKIRAPRSIIDSLDSDNIIATADFNNLTMQNTIDIQLSSNKYSSNIESITGSIETVKLNIEELKKKTLVLSVVTSGEAEEGYLIGDITPAQNQVRISGPESVVSKVVSAQAEISVANFKQDISTDADIKLFDADGNTVSSDLLSTNMKSVKVNVEILQTKRVGFEFETIGTPADGYEANGSISSSPDSVVIAGRPAALKNIESITVASDALNITGQTGDMMTLVNVSPYLPAGVTLADTTTDGTVSVTVGIEKTAERRLELPSDAIVWEDVPEGFEVELVEPLEAYFVVIKGLRNNISSLTADNITATADLTGILEQEDTAGNSYHTTLRFKSDNGDLKVAEPVQVWFKLISVDE